MARTKLYQVRDNRIRFRCEICDTKRSLAVSPNVRSRSVRCHKCGSHFRCMLNRRMQHREQQSGKATLVLSSGKELAVDLQDISLGGVSISTVNPGGGRMVSLGEEVQLKCNWNRTLFTQGRYYIRSIAGSRIGIQRVMHRVLL